MLCTSSHISTHYLVLSFVLAEKVIVAEVCPNSRFDEFASQARILLDFHCVTSREFSQPFVRIRNSPRLTLNYHHSVKRKFSNSRPFSRTRENSPKFAKIKTIRDTPSNLYPQSLPQYMHSNHKSACHTLIRTTAGCTPNKKTSANSHFSIKENSPANSREFASEFAILHGCEFYSANSPVT